MMSDRPVRVLQFGLGARGRTWARIVQRTALALPAGYVDPRAEARAWAAAEGPNGVPVFEHADDALRHVDAEVALVVTPPQDRLALLPALFARGLHGLVEKPLALTMDDAVAIVHAASRAGVRLGVVHNFRYLPATRVLRERVRGGRYGAPTFVTLSYIRNRDGHAPHLNKYPLGMAQPMLLEQSLHHFDLLRYVYGAEPEEITCMTWNPKGSMYRDDACAAALIRFDSGLAATYHGTWVSGSDVLEFQWRTDFEHGVIIQRDLFGDLVEGGTADTELTSVPLPPLDRPMTDSGGLFEEFLLAVRRGEPFAASGRDHLRTLAMTLACVESAQASTRVSMADFFTRHTLETTP